MSFPSKRFVLLLSGHGRCQDAKQSAARRRFCSLALIVLLLESIAAAWGADKDRPKFDPAPVTSYESRQTIDKLTIAVRPYVTDEEARPAFGKNNPNKYGVLPVLVVMRNDGSQVLSLDRMRVKYITPRGEDIEATPAEELRYVLGGSRPGASPSPLPRLPGSGRKKNPLDAWEITGRAFAARMLAPGESAHGFVYFQTGHRSQSRIYVTAIREAASGKELFFFEIPLGSER
jgi:hypothetical protein